MRILSIAPFLTAPPMNPNVGGKSKSSREINEYILRHGHELAIVPWAEPVSGNYNHVFLKNLPSIKIYGWPEIKEISYTRLLLDLIGWLKDFNQLPKTTFRNKITIMLTCAIKMQGIRNAVHDFKPDIIHGHYTRGDFGICYKKTRLNVPYVQTCRSSLTGWKRNPPWMKYNFSIPIHTVFVGYSYKDSIEKAWGKLPTNESVIQNHVNDAFHEIRITQDKNRRGACYCGHFSESKNVMTLAKACEILKFAEITFIGSGPLEEELESSLTSKSKILKYLSSADVAQEMASSKLFILPSKGEAFAFVYAESLCCGTPIIGYPPLIYELEKTLNMRVGYAFDANKHGHERLAETISEALMDSELLSDEYRAKLSNRARECFSMSNVFSKYMNLFERIIREHPEEGRA